MVLLCWVLASTVQVTLHGLRADENVRLIDPGRTETREVAHGRLRDATTGAPVVGATIEAWTENWNADGRMVASTLSAADGSFVVFTSDAETALATGAGPVEKFRIRAPSHRSTVVPRSDLGEEVWLLPKSRPVSVRVLDLNGQPIANATLRTHQTCAHAPAASSTVSGPDGMLLIDDFPPLEDSSDLQIDAPGFESIYGFDVAELLTSTPPCELWLGRRKPTRFAVLRADGTPAAGERLRQGAAPDWHAKRTDANGRIEFASLFDSPINVHTHIDGREATVYGGPHPGASTVLVRLGGDSYLGADDDATFHLERAPESALYEVAVLHELGWWHSRYGSFEFPAGRARIIAGGPFTGFERVELDVTLAPNSEEHVQVPAKPEPILTLTSSGTRFQSVTFEADGESTRVWWEPGSQVAVPRGRPLSIVAVGANGVHAGQHPGVREDAEFDVATLPEIRKRVDPRDETNCTVSLRFQHPDIAPSAPRVRLFGPWQLIDADDERYRDHVVAVPPGVPFEAWISADGFVTRCITGVTPVGVRELVLDAKLQPMARIELTGEFVALRDGNLQLPEHDADPDARLRTWAVAPGPRHLTIELPDSRRLRVELNVLPGETRRLELR